MNEKVCHKCKVSKPLTHFHRNRREPDGHHTRCKECRKSDSKKHYDAHKDEICERMRTYYHSGGGKERQQSGSVKAYQKAYKHTAKYKKQAKQYRQTEQGKAVQKRFVQSDKGKACTRRKYLRNKYRYKAYAAIQKAIKEGRLKPVSAHQCVVCRKQAEFYHHHSYEKPFWLDVIPLCRSCHTLIHT